MKFQKKSICSIFILLFLCVCYAAENYTTEHTPLFSSSFSSSPEHSSGTIAQVSSSSAPSPFKVPTLTSQELREIQAQQALTSPTKFTPSTHKREREETQNVATNKRHRPHQEDKPDFFRSNAYYGDEFLNEIEEEKAEEGEKEKAEAAEEQKAENKNNFNPWGTFNCKWQALPGETQKECFYRIFDIKCDSLEKYFDPWGTFNCKWLALPGETQIECFYRIFGIKNEPTEESFEEKSPHSKSSDK